MVVRWLWGDSVLSVKLMISIGIILARRDVSGMGSENNIPNITELCARLLYMSKKISFECVLNALCLCWGIKPLHPYLLNYYHSSTDQDIVKSKRIIFSNFYFPQYYSVSHEKCPVK